MPKIETIQKNIADIESQITSLHHERGEIYLLADISGADTRESNDVEICKELNRLEKSLKMWRKKERAIELKDYSIARALKAEKEREKEAAETFELVLSDIEVNLKLGENCPVSLYVADQQQVSYTGEFKAENAKFIGWFPSMQQAWNEAVSNVKGKGRLQNTYDVFCRYFVMVAESGVYVRFSDILEQVKQR